jgi:GTP cyclohydrolase I/GTP cyclohydrolase-4
MVRQAVERFEALGAEAFVLARQENMETIHRHNVVAERHGLMGELRQELSTGDHLPHHTTVREWLEGRA